MSESARADTTTQRHYRAPPASERIRFTRQDQKGERAAVSLRDS